jgi:ABC-type phosphate/phosphonate transport system substrate-binding protein
LVLVGAAVGLTPRAVAAEPGGGAAPGAAPIRLGLMSTMFRDVPPALVEAGAGPFRNLFRKFTGLPGGVELIDSHLDMAAKLNANELDLGVFHGFEWAWVKTANPQLAALTVTIPTKPPQSCIVVHATSKATKPADLKGEEVSVPVGTKAHGYLYLEGLQKNLKADSFTPKKRAKWGPPDALDAILEEDTPAALVDASAFAAYQNNKPGAAKQLRVLCQSDVFPATVIVYRKGGLDAAAIRKIETGLLKANTDPEGKAFLMLWSLKGFGEIPANYEESLQRTLKQYPSPDKVSAPK